MPRTVWYFKSCVSRWRFAGSCRLLATPRPRFWKASSVGRKTVRALKWHMFERKSSDVNGFHSFLMDST